MPTPWMRALPAAGLAVLAAAVAILPWPASPTAGAARSLRVTARDFTFTPSVLRVEPGDVVTLELTSGDYVHGLRVEGYGVDLTADPGQTARATFVADRPGTFRLRCTVTCGALHPFMTGRLQVGPRLALARSLVLALLAVLGGGLTLHAPGTNMTRKAASR